MGFYGNITNTSRTQFTFDRIYSSRYEMDFNCKDDGVYAGRYVLVEYESDFSEDIYRKDFYYVEGNMYTQMDTTHGPDGYAGPIATSLVTAAESNIEDGTIAKIVAGRGITDVNKVPRYIRILKSNDSKFEEITEADYLSYWSGNALPNLEDASSLHAHIVNGVLTNKSPAMVGGMCLCAPIGYAYKATLSDTYYMATVRGKTLTWQQINSGSTNFSQNFNIDTKRYGTSRGYDSTVWQKVYTSIPDATTGSPNLGRYEKYVMIAELNTVVPTFDICADAPSIVPIAPHFDANSTNVYYRFHWQPQWGIRTKAANSGLMGPDIDSHGGFGKLPYVRLTSDGIIYPSDQKTTWSGKFYNSQTDKYVGATKENVRPTLYYNPTEKRWSGTEAGVDTEIEAAVYYNKAGFDPNTIVYSDDILDPTKPGYDASIRASGWKNKDNIQLAPTGRSGHKYNPHDGTVDAIPQEDTQEFSLMLPSLGNSIASMWDLVYGGRDTNEKIAKTNLRNLDIAWEDAANAPHREGLRLVNADSTENGYELTDLEANTLAGCINSVHDLMGMIIVDNADDIVTDSNMDEIDPDAIYYYPNSNTFKRKHEGYTYKEVVYDYVPVLNVSAKDYKPNYYYLDNKGTTIADGDYKEGTTYYEKILADTTKNDLYESIVLSEYKKGSYYKTLSGEWRYETADSPLDGIKYYNFIKAEKIELNGSYEPDTVFYKEDNSFILSRTETSIPNYKYYRIREDENQQVNLNLRDPALYNSSTGLYADNQELIYLYTPGYFYYKELDSNGEETKNFLRENRTIEQLEHLGYWDEDGFLKVPVLDDKGNQRIDDAGKLRFYQYLVLDAKTQKNSTIIMGKDEDGNVIEKEVISGNVTIYGQYKTKIRKFEKNKFYYIDGHADLVDEYGNITSIVSKYTLLTESLLKYHYDMQFIDIEDGNIPSFTDYFTIHPITQGTFYTSSTFWYKTPEDHYVRDNNDVITPDRVYYEELVFRPINAIYYVPNKYYIYDQSEGLYTLDTRKNFVAADPHFIRKDVYVLSDELNIFDRGSVWNYKVGPIPATVRLAKRETKWEMVELEGFARTLNTVHGLIMRINKMLEVNDKETRDPKTVQGCINILNDYITKLNELNPREICVVDSYGRLHSSEWTTAQKFSTTNLQTAHASEHNENEFESVTLTKRLYVPYKYYYLSNEKYVLDTNKEFTTGRQYFCKTENRWLYLDVNPDPRKPEIILQHRYNAVDDTVTTSDKNIALTASQASYRGNNNSHSDTLDLYTPIIDATGHVVGKNIETVTLPFGFKILKAENSSDDSNKWPQTDQATSSTGENVKDIVADNTQDTLTVKGGNKWIRLQTDGSRPTASANTNSKTSADGNNIFTIAHSVVANNFGGQKSNSQNASPKFGDNFKVPIITVDNAGHVTAFATETVKIPDLGLTNATSGNVVTGISYTYTNSGTFTETKTNLGNIQLGTYTKPTDVIVNRNGEKISGSDILTTTTLSNALNILDKRIMNVEKTVKDLETRLADLEKT